MKEFPSLLLHISFFPISYLQILQGFPSLQLAQSNQSEKYNGSWYIDYKILAPTFRSSFKPELTFVFLLVLTSSPCSPVRKAPVKWMSGSMGSLGWRWTETAGRGRIPWGSIPMVLTWHGAAPPSLLNHMPEPAQPHTPLIIRQISKKKLLHHQGLFESKNLWRENKMEEKDKGKPIYFFYWLDQEDEKKMNVCISQNNQNFNLAV